MFALFVLLFVCLLCSVFYLFLFCLLLLFCLCFVLFRFVFCLFVFLLVNLLLVAVVVVVVVLVGEFFACLFICFGDVCFLLLYLNVF